MDGVDVAIDVGLVLESIAGTEKVGTLVRSCMLLDVHA